MLTLDNCVSSLSNSYEHSATGKNAQKNQDKDVTFTETKIQLHTNAHCTCTQWDFSYLVYQHAGVLTPLLLVHGLYS
jgi:hypothetical protein